MLVTERLVQDTSNILLKYVLQRGKNAAHASAFRHIQTRHEGLCQSALFQKRQAYFRIMLCKRLELCTYRCFRLVHKTKDMNACDSMSCSRNVTHPFRIMLCKWQEHCKCQCFWAWSPWEQTLSPPPPSPVSPPKENLLRAPQNEQVNTRVLVREQTYITAGKFPGHVMPSLTYATFASSEAGMCTSLSLVQHFSE